MKPVRPMLFATEVLICSSHVQGQTRPASTAATPPAIESATQPAAKPPDLCTGPVDPYHPVRERVRFFGAAGVDNEIDAKEFDAQQGKPDSFIRVFDRWKEMLRFDKNNSKTIDWFEADAYRQSLRGHILKVFDADKDQRLTGAERDAANRALAAGNVFPRATHTGDPFAAQSTPELIRRFDADGDGRLSDEERRAAVGALREQQQQRFLERYDKDGDGKLNDEERAAMRDEMRSRQKPWQDMFDKFNLRHFDLDADGKLDEEENADLGEFQGELLKIGKGLDLRQNDLDRDGKVTPEERQQAAREWRTAGWRFMLTAMQYMDADADGAVSEAERWAFVAKMRDALGGWIESYTARFDEDEDGRLSKPERAEMVNVFRRELHDRIGRFDADRDGRLKPAEMLKFVVDFAGEVGIQPIRRPATAPATPESDRIPSGAGTPSGSS